MTNAPSGAVEGLFASIFSAFRFHFLISFQMSIEAIEAVLPEMAIGFDPLRHLLQRLRLQAAGTRLGRATPRNEASPLQHFQVLRDRRLRHVEGLSQLVDRGL